MIQCQDCQLPYPENSLPYRCPRCGGIYSLQQIDLQIESAGDWSLSTGSNLPESAELITLGEGNTPLIWSNLKDRRVGFKLESLNPTGSFKDRGTSVLVSRARALGITRLVEDSSGNAGASLAAYSVRAGIDAQIYIPADASGPKLDQIARFGAQVIPVQGPRENAAAAVMEAVNKGEVYASHAYLPLGIPGIAAIAYELYHQIPGCPGAVLVPVGHGSLLLGVYHGFKALQAVGLIKNLPVLVGIQSADCDPLVQAFNQGAEQAAAVETSTALADGVSITNPIHDREILEAIKATKGRMVRVDDNQLLIGKQKLSSFGLDVELTSALVWNPLVELIDELPKPVVCIISGHGLKSGSRFDYLD